MSPPLIGLAHGSRDPRFARTVEEVMAQVRRLRPGLSVVAAHLELSSPDLGTTCRALTGDRAVVVPLLFARAFHARIDVPRAVREAASENGIRLDLAEIIGLGDDIMDVLDRSAGEAGISSQADVVLVAVGSSNARANADMLTLADRWASRRGTLVTVGFTTCSPRAGEVLATARAEGRCPAVVPLFLAPGLLLDQVLALPSLVGVKVAAPLGASVAEIVLRRYDAIDDGLEVCHARPTVVAPAPSRRRAGSQRPARAPAGAQDAAGKLIVMTE